MKDEAEGEIKSGNFLDSQDTAPQETMKSKE